MNQTTTKNGITFPDKYKTQFRKERIKMTSDEKTSAIRELIVNSKGKAIRGEDFIKALDGLTTAPAFVASLVKKGRVKRTQVNNGATGYNYHYDWVYGNVVKQSNPVTHNLEPVTISGRVEYATAYELKRLQAWFLDYMDKTEDMSALAQANKFRKFVMNGGEIEKAPTEDKFNEE